MLDGLLFSVHHISLECWIEVTWVTKHLQVTADSFLSFVLSLPLDVNVLMFCVKVTKHFIQELEQFKRGLVIEFDERKIAHKWRAVETINNLLDFRC